MPTKIINSLGIWPCPALGEDFTAGLNQWREVDEATHDYFRAVLPPIYFNGGFFVSEPCRHIGDEPTYNAVATVGGRYFMRELPESHGPDAVDLLLAEVHP